MIKVFLAYVSHFLKMSSTYADDQDSRHRALEELQEHHKVAENPYKSKAKDKVI
jgi:hypothetical protein